MKCSNCGRVNPDENTFCENCMNLLVAPKYIMPVVGLCISLAQEAARKTLPLEDFLVELKKVREHLKEYQAQAAESEKTEVALDIVTFAHEKLREGYRLFGEGLNSLELYASDSESSHLIRGLEQLFKASISLFEVDFVAELAQKVIPPPVGCFKCGHLNPNRSRFCEQCKAVLPHHVGQEEPPAFVYYEGSSLSGDTQGLQSEYFLKLKDSVKDVSEGKMSSEEFKGILDWLLRLVQQGIDQFKRVQFPSGSQDPEAEKVKEVKEWMENGLSFYLSGLHEMEKFLSDGDRQHLALGLVQAQDGSNLLLKVALIDREYKQNQQAGKAV